jgi:phosphoribosylformimino-5-aminoimidazole carboxamide ribotide isomerase
MTVPVIPVLDVKAGRAVHAVGGRRDHYAPVRSVLHASPDPVALARAFRDRLGLRRLYLADLDAIAGAPPDLALYRSIQSPGVDLWVDAGLRNVRSARALLSAGVSTVVVGLETTGGPSALTAILHEVDPRRVVFSLDLRDGRPVTAPGSDWPVSDPIGLASCAISSGLRRVILLDLSRVGRGQGVGTLPLAERLSAEHPGLEITVGGGIAGSQDLRQLEGTVVSSVLLASALHDGRISVQDLREKSGGMRAYRIPGRE